ncbi:L-2-hydroxyglutarate oxidase LhgO [Geosmithia morbida]|uniref:L-2-hydroxyglutarate dehydrogenase, mitochondrial n=1 Tax=Geosmithia morbida TaxID=1094350 RepID=A0A9P4Z4Y2_9HYPO|nr:L-2-hydroxyglutarate oxidase LhgO [Geosmithia morbida]KAF4126749.1 L-2-hydroxyglutarate oxidase LhgO [Geosmithia morbida]
MAIRHGARAAISRTPSSRYFSTTRATQADFTHAVIGGGVVGLAIARQLSQRTGTSTVLLERHSAVGMETSSRNSEVIHAGIYYGKGSLKTDLCVRGKDLLYSLCEARGVGHARVGKWIVAQTDAQAAALERIERHCREDIGVPVRWVAADEVRREGEGVRADAAVLDSPTTGIVDSHGLMVCLTGLFEDAGGVVALNSPVRAVSPLPSAASRGRHGWSIRVGGDGDGDGDEASATPRGRDGDDENQVVITADTVINAAGLGAVDVHNMMVVDPADRRRPLSYAKGTYFSYAASQPRISRLIYPVPEPGAGGLGTHLTLDLAGRLRFGPDVEWVDSPHDLAPSADRFDLAVAEIKKYLPQVDVSSLAPDYAGIRPKLANHAAVGADASTFQDFIIRNEPGYHGWVNLLGIESPGLTSSLAIGEKVEELMYGSVTAA